MNALPPLALAILASAVSAVAQPALTIYSQNFATVRDQIALDLKEGVNDVKFEDTTAHVEPDSVMLRDPSGQVPLHILEQNYRADPLSEGLLLSLNEGKMIDFFIPGANGRPDRTVKGKIIRSGYLPASLDPALRYSRFNGYYGPQSQAPGSQAIIEVDGQLQFGLPGQPRFPSLGTDTVLKPQLSWKLHAGKAAQVRAELAYVTGGMNWEAAYNVVSPENGDVLDLTGWVTMGNNTGKTFTDAKVQLVAGDVAKIVQNQDGFAAGAGGVVFSGTSSLGFAPQVTEKAFDEYHLYSLPLPTTLHDSETKQVEFVRGSGIPSQRVFVYDGLQLDQNRWRGYNISQLRYNEDYGADPASTKVGVMREIKNGKAGGLGLPLPKGKVRFYRKDSDGQLQFTGENTIDHTATDETLRIYTGNAFDLVGERIRTSFKGDHSNHWFDEGYKITLRNHKKEPAEIRVIEHLFRWHNWEIREPSATFLKTSAQMIEFRIPLKPDEERTVSYTVHYSW